MFDRCLIGSEYKPKYQLPINLHVYVKVLLFTQIENNDKYKDEVEIDF